MCAKIFFLHILQDVFFLKKIRLKNYTGVWMKVTCWFSKKIKGKKREKWKFLESVWMIFMMVVLLLCEWVFFLSGKMSEKNFYFPFILRVTIFLFFWRCFFGLFKGSCIIFQQVVWMGWSFYHIMNINFRLYRFWKKLCTKNFTFKFFRF